MSPPGFCPAETFSPCGVHQHVLYKDVYCSVIYITKKKWNNQ